ncbi:MAG: hypothetical protein R3275_01900 [Saprospiraceae bacterium]|nr:hypothetical protein [Saprospiraceae bacterium]
MRFHLITALVLITLSCQEKGNHPLFDEVMAIHDEVMPKVSDMSKLSRELKKEKQNLQDSSMIARYDQRIRELNEAEEAMFDWMRDFDAKRKTDEAYLKKEKKNIKEVSELMLSSISNAQKLLENNDE